MERKGELSRRELCHGLDENVRDDLILESVGVELVPLSERSAYVFSHIMSRVSSQMFKDQTAL